MHKKAKAWSINQLIYWSGRWIGAVGSSIGRLGRRLRMHGHCIPFWSLYLLAPNGTCSSVAVQWSCLGGCLWTICVHATACSMHGSYGIELVGWHTLAHPSLYVMVTSVDNWLYLCHCVWWSNVHLNVFCDYSCMIEHVNRGLSSIEVIMHDCRTSFRL